MSVDDIEERLQKHLPDLAELDATVKLVLDDGAVLFLDATEDPAVLSRTDDTADCTIKMSSANLIKLMDGKLDPMLAYAMGKLKVSGKTGIAMKLASTFK